MVVDVHSMPLHMESIDTNSSRCRKRKSAGRRHARENEEEVCAKEHMTHDVCEASVRTTGVPHTCYTILFFKKI